MTSAKARARYLKWRKEFPPLAADPFTMPRRRYAVLQCGRRAIKRMKRRNRQEKP